MKYLLIVLLPLLIAGCSKREVVDYPIRTGLKNMFNWKQGSYWLMQDSTTGRIDSFYLGEYSSKIYEFNDQMRERIALQLFAADRSGQNNFVYLSFTLEYVSHVNINCFVNDSLGGSSSTDYVDYVNPSAARNTNISIIAGGKTYSNTFYSDYPVSGGQAEQLSLAVDEPNGLILLRIKTHTGTITWTLVNSKIVRN